MRRGLSLVVLTLAAVPALLAVPVLGRTGAATRPAASRLVGIPLTGDGDALGRERPGVRLGRVLTGAAPNRRHRWVTITAGGPAVRTISTGTGTDARRDLHDAAGAARPHGSTRSA